MSVDWVPGREAGTQGMLACPPDVAQWLHDEIVQRLCSVVAALGSEWLDSTDRVRCRVELEAALCALRSLLTDGLARVREPELATVAEAVQVSCRAIDGCTPELRLTGDAPISPAVGRLVTDFVAEALRNVAKHACATLIVLTVTVDDDCVMVDVVNDGVCPGPGSVGAGVGLHLLRARALRHDGAITAAAANTGEWCARLTLPLPRPSTVDDARNGGAPR